MIIDDHLLKNIKIYKQIELNCEQNLQFFLNKHSTKEGTWGVFQLQTGTIDFVFLDGQANEIARHEVNNQNSSLIIPPASWHKIILKSSDFKATLKFACQPHRYFEKKYRLAPIHSDLWQIYQTYLKQQEKMSILDIGCGLGRNPLVLALSGHDITAVDINAKSIQKINEIAAEEQLTINTQVHDLNQQLPFAEEQFDFIYSTVTFQFLHPTRIHHLITELQTLTIQNGLHCLVFPIKAEPYYYPENFTYLANQQELYHFYQDAGWSIIEYNEKPGQLHKLDNTGKPIQGLFGLLLAQKKV
ncbi:SAM-dependent methyltransferase TehB [Legionella gresilensis]|uniref:SAM-dependent methyltransferase TehB n=1 Tax=Legionella gresilensis TaxID=91823 RepID=UPI00104177E7|nr:SAM-dependent methyltransferase TehB [Legionella gresilensis]